ncbi:hypothetical protein BHYA_0023g00150 [Botrytis hyacinthi]|uniref:Uncharacterized protein n=1 Tax=Botrytis hyacinthi TaxID=278943 RepID=A0A4Z1GXP0_9HELO|nr:hypothetical protein BHYA_0023g00150 [Botrytis hyacinthi]
MSPSLSMCRDLEFFMLNAVPPGNIQPPIQSPRFITWVLFNLKLKNNISLSTRLQNAYCT